MARAGHGSLRDLIEACFTRFFSLTPPMRGQLVASLGWWLISLAEKDLATSSNFSGKQRRGVILKLQLSKKDSLTDKKKPAYSFLSGTSLATYMHLNSYLQNRFLAVPSRSRRLIFTHISKLSISALVILHDHAVQRIRRLTCAHFLKVMFLCVQLG